MSNLLSWHESFDDADNSIYTAASCVHDGDSAFEWRVTHIVEGNTLAWTLQQSDAELLDADEAGERYSSPAEAMADVEVLEAAWREEAAREQ